MAQSQNSTSLFNTEALQGMDNPRTAIIYTEWNDSIVGEQLKGCKKVLEEYDAQILDCIAVPGSFEIPFACRRLWRHYEILSSDLQPEVIITFGAVIRGGTPHFEYVCKAVTEGVLQLNLSLPIPVIFGVLTLENEAQAWERLGGAYGHKGEEAALSALKMINICRKKGC